MGPESPYTLCIWLLLWQWGAWSGSPALEENISFTEYVQVSSLTAGCAADNGHDNLAVTVLLELIRLRYAESRGLFSGTPFWFPGSLAVVEHLNGHAVSKL